MKELIRKILDKHPVLFAIARIVRNKNNMDFISLVNGLEDNPNIVFLVPKQDIKYDGKAVCAIQAGTENDGFFACVRWALDGLYFCDKMNFVPVIYFAHNSIYFDEEVFGNDKNPFNYYFDDVESIDIGDLCGKPQIDFNPRNSLLAENMNGKLSYAVSNRYIEEMAYIMRKYLHFNSEVQAYMDLYIKDLRINEETLGVHIRGTDYKLNYRNHPNFVGSTEYFREIDHLLESRIFKKIFLATDDNDILDEFKNHYDEEQIIYSNKVERSNGVEGVHTRKNKGKTPYELGLDVIGDMGALSKCGGILSGMSQVALISRVYKQSNNESYIYDRILNKGINKNGRLYKNE